MAAAKPNSVSFRVPYRNLQDAEVEMVAVDEHQLQGIDLNSPSSARCNNEGPESSSSTPHVRPTPNSLIILVLSCTIAAGVQFGWALQLSLLTPYIQVLYLACVFFFQSVARCLDSVFAYDPDCVLREIVV